MNSMWKVIFGIMVFVTLISSVYAFVQQTVANQTRRYSEEQRALAEQFKVEAEKSRHEAERQAMIAADIQLKLEQCVNKK